MLDRHEAQDGRNDIGHENRDVAADRSQADRPLADREVPLPGLAGESEGEVTVLQQWLDGDATEVDARRSDTKQVDLWNRISAETDRRRRMATPAHLSAQIMAALPTLETRTTTVTETSAIPHAEPARSAGLAPWMMIAVGVAFFALGIVVGKMFM